MYVVSIKGVVKKDQVFYYISEEDDKLIFTDRFNKAMSFSSEKEAKEWAQDNYTKLLQMLVSYRGPKIFNNTLAIRKINFKTIAFINEDIFKEEVEENVNNEGNDACDEVSYNGNLGESGMADESDENAGEAGSSDIQ